MKQNGVQFTCDGCGITTFIEDADPKLRNISTGGILNIALQPNQSESWARVDVIFDLCPACQKKWEKMLCDFHEAANRDQTSCG